MTQTLVILTAFGLQFLSIQSQTLPQNCSQNGTISTKDCVVINELVHKPPKGQKDWIELYNKCDEQLDLKGFFLCDSNSESPFVFGDSYSDSDGKEYNCTHIIIQKSYLTLVRDKPCSFTFGLSKKDEVRLIDTQNDLVDIVSWGEKDAPEGKSWARKPNGVGQFATAIPTFNEVNQQPEIIGKEMVNHPSDVTVVINEVVPFPQSSEEDWIELFNYGSMAVDLTGLWLTDEKKGEKDRFVFGKTGCESVAIIRPQQFLVLQKHRNCSFTFGLGLNDEVLFWLDEQNLIDSIKYGPEAFFLSVPRGASWGRLPNGIGTPTYLYPTKGSENQRAMRTDRVKELINEQNASGKN